MRAVSVQERIGQLALYAMKKGVRNVDVTSGLDGVVIVQGKLAGAAHSGDFKGIVDAFGNVISLAQNNIIMKRINVIKPAKGVAGASFRMTSDSSKSRINSFWATLLRADGGREEVGISRFPLCENGERYFASHMKINSSNKIDLTAISARFFVEPSTQPTGAIYLKPCANERRSRLKFATSDELEAFRHNVVVNWGCLVLSIRENLLRRGAISETFLNDTLITARKNG